MPPPGAQMVSEPPRAAQPACLLCGGHARGGRGSSRYFTPLSPSNLEISGVLQRPGSKAPFPLLTAPPECRSTRGNPGGTAPRGRCSELTRARVQSPAPSQG